MNANRRTQNRGGLGTRLHKPASVIISADKRLNHKRRRILASDRARGSVDGSTLGRGSTFDIMGRRRWRTRGDTSTLMVGREEERKREREEEERE